MGKRWAESFRFIGIGWYVAVCIILGALGGRWIGQQIGGSGTVAILTVVGVLAGLALAFVGMYRMMKPLLSQRGEDDRGEY